MATMLIRDDVFDAFLECRSKAHFGSSLVAAARPDSHPIREWRRHVVAEQFEQLGRAVPLEDAGSE
jgi:hypothetical protein